MESSVQSLVRSGDVLFLLLGAVMVFAMHAGFAFLEVGTVRKRIRPMLLLKSLRTGLSPRLFTSLSVILSLTAFIFSSRLMIFSGQCRGMSWFVSSSCSVLLPVYRQLSLAALPNEPNFGRRLSPAQFLPVYPIPCSSRLSGDRTVRAFRTFYKDIWCSLS